MEAETRFAAMGCDVHVLVVGGPLSLLDVAREFIEELERRWSRFRPSSEISRLNRLAGRPVGVSAETLALVRHALEGARITGGRYDPTVLGAVIRAGYDRSFELLTGAAPRGQSPLGLGYGRVAVDPALSTVTLPRGVGFDPGGIGKGYAADLLVQQLLSQGAAGACANVGGDLRVDGDAPGGGSWVIAIQHPLRRQPAATVRLAGGAVATSTSVRRAWGQRGDRRHHLIDPATGLPARTGVLSATVVAARGWQAEVVAKAAFIAGAADGLALLAAAGTDGLLVDDRGGLHPSAGFQRFTARREAARSVVWGLLLSTRALGGRPRPPWLFDLHRFLGGLTVIFTAVHVLALLADSYVHFSLVNVLVPLTGTWHPLAVAWGIVGLYLLLAVELTSLARTRLPRRAWRRVHFASFALFIVATVHALSAGTDRRSPAFLLGAVASCGVVALLTAVRMTQSFSGNSQERFRLAQGARPIMSVDGGARSAPAARSGGPHE